MVYVLDTNIVIRYLRNVPKVRRNVRESAVRGDFLIVPKVVNYEIKRGFSVLRAPNKETAYSVLTEPAGWCDIAEMDDGSWERAEQVYAELYRKGFTIGELDILIAAFCLEKEYTLVTNNTKHFENIDGLNIVDWTE